MFERIAGLVLYDGYAVPSYSKWVRWRRCPYPSELGAALTQHRGPLHYSSVRLANALKLLSIFSPMLYIYPYWALNNPLMMYLSTLKRDEPNCIVPMFQHRFLRAYWGVRDRMSFSELLQGLYPSQGKPYLPRNSSWLDDLYHDPSCRGTFEALIRKHIQAYADSCLCELDKEFEQSHSVQEDPMYKMLELADDLSKDPLVGRIPPTIATTHIHTLLRDLVDYFSARDSLFDMSEARQRWREEAYRREYAGCLRMQECVDWFIRDNIYLPSHAEATRSVAAAYSQWSACPKSIKRIPQPVVEFRKDEAYISFGGELWPLRHQQSMQRIENALDKLSFRFIFEHIRAQEYHRKYLVMLSEAARNTDPASYLSAILGAMCFLLGCTSSSLYRETAEPCFKDPGVWKVIGWDIDYGNGSIFASIGPVAGGLVAFAAYSTPLAVILGLLAGGLASTVRKLPQVDTYLKKQRGRRMLVSLAKSETKEDR